MLDLCERQVFKLTRLIDEVLSVGRIQTGSLDMELESVDLVALVQEVSAGFAAELEQAHCAVSIDAPAAVVGWWDRTKIEQVITNVLSNAIKFGAGKPIEVIVREQEGTARLVVRDHGIGIPADRLPHIFERFERAVSTREFGGLGLGLFILRALVKEHGGRVTAESSVGVGSTFTIELPCEDRRHGQ
jgi:signal transduction histidine kinase